MSDIIQGLLYLLVLILGAWCKLQEGRIKDLETFKDKVTSHWEQDAKTYVTKTELSDLAKEIKECLVRIEDKIDRRLG